GVIVSGHRVYGTTTSGGTNNSLGTVFTIGDDGSTYTNLQSFGAPPEYGYFPFGGVTLAGNTLYGTEFMGGSGSPPVGTGYQINTDGSLYEPYFTFNTGASGERPYSSVIAGANGEYGTAIAGGTEGIGN